MSKLSEHDKAVLNCIFNPNLPVHEVNEDEMKDEGETEKIEIDAVRMAEMGNFAGAVEILNDAIKNKPEKASLYNNRAQVNQLKGCPDDAFKDLVKAIELCKDGQKCTLCQALCQRGLLYMKYGKDELAREDFENAAKRGSTFAKSQLVEMNPYAAMCNQMLRKVFEDLK